MDRDNLTKRQAIEQEIKDIVLSDRKAILKDNLLRRRARLGHLQKGDFILLYEFFKNRKKEHTDDDDFLYRIVEGKIIQVTRSGFFVEGRTSRGTSVCEYVNKAHIINGTVRLVAKKKKD